MMRPAARTGPGRLLSCHAKKLQALRGSTLPLRLLDQLFNQPVISISRVAGMLRVTPRTARLNIDKLVRLGILTEATGRERNRLFVARKILSIAEADDQVSAYLQE